MAVVLYDMQMPKGCAECRFCRSKPPYPYYCYAGEFLIKPSETDLRNADCPLRECFTKEEMRKRSMSANDGK